MAQPAPRDDSIRVPARWVWIAVAALLGLTAGGGGTQLLAGDTWNKDKDLIEYRLERIEDKLDDIAAKLGVNQ